MLASRLSGLLIGLALLLGANRAFATTQFYIDASPGDGEVVSGYVLNEFQQDIGASTGCQMTTENKNADYILEVVSIVDDTGDNGQDESSAYSVTLTDGNGQYITSIVGVCGTSKVADCGDSLYRDILHDLPSGTSC